MDKAGFCGSKEQRLELQEAFWEQRWVESSRWGQLRIFRLHLPLAAYSPCQRLTLQGDSTPQLDIMRDAERRWTVP